MSGEQYGIAYGQTMATVGSPTRAINGLTVSRLMTFYAPSTNAIPVFVGNLNVTTGSGFELEAGKFPVVVDTNNRNDIWYIIATAPGATLTYISTDMA